MKFRDLVDLWRSDLYRYEGNVSSKTFIKHLLTNPAFKYSFFLRLTHYLSGSGKNPLFVISYLILRRYKFKYGFEIPHKTKIGFGLYLGHFSAGIIVNHQAVIGNNCALSHGVTIGVTNRGKNKGTPIIGDNVYIGPGAKIIGAIKIGHHAAIGANCIVTKDVPDHAVVVGVPGRIISYEGSEGYAVFTDYRNRNVQVPKEVPGVTQVL